MVAVLLTTGLAACGGSGSGKDTFSGTAPTITTQPQSQTVTVGATATFSVVATGTAPLSYQWSKDGMAIGGATDSSYTTAATVIGDNGSTFTVTVTNVAGSQTSTTVTLTVTATAVAPTITTQPQNQTVTVGATATFSVVATGTAPLTYQWSKGGVAIGGATNSSYTTPATVSGDDGSTFTVTVSNVAGSKTSTTATLTVTAAAVAPTITTQPQNQTVVVGATATFSVVAAGTAPLTYQWSKGGVAIGGATSSSYTTPATVSGDNGSTFTVTVSNAAGSKTSNAATLTVNVPPAITTQPQSQTVTVGATATFSVVATGTAPLTYQWSKGGVAIGGATNSSYTTPATVIGDSGSTFTVTVSNAAGSKTSTTATLTVTAAAVAPTITTQPQSQTATVGATATFSVVATGTAPLTYQWSKGGVAIGGATNSSYTTPATVSGDNGSTFTVTVSNVAGSKTSNAATLTVNVPPAITTQPQSQTVTVGATATFSVVATGTAPLTYQWSKGGVAIGGATNSSYTTPATVSGDNGSTFTVTVSNVAGSKTSNAATLTVNVPPTIATQPQNQTVTVGATATFSVVATGTTPLTYQWSKGGVSIGGATSSSYTTPATVSGDNGSTFTVTVTNVAGSKTSNAATLTVNVPPTITTQPQNQTVTVGATATFSVVATGTAPLTYQWSKGGVAIGGATNSSYTTPATVSGDNGSTFTVTVSNVAGSKTSNAATLTVNVPPAITTQPQNQTVAVGATATFSVVATGTAPLTYQWSKGGVAIGGATNSSYTTPATVSGDNGSTFTVTVTNVSGSKTSNAATLTVTGGAIAPTITTQPLSQAVTVGATAVFTVVATGTAPLTYQWYKNGTAIGGATSSIYTTPITVIGDNGSTFTVTVSNTAGSKTSNVATLTVTAVGAATPVMFQHISSSTNPAGNGIPGHAFVFHTEALPPNTVAVMGVSAPSSVTVTISDTLTGAWATALCTASGGSGNANASLFVQALGAGGTDTITINVGSASVQPVQFDITFWQNISTSAPANGSLCAGSVMPGSGGVVNPGSFAPTTNNDTNGGNVIWNYTPLCTTYAQSNPSSWTPASGFTLLNGDIIWTTNNGFPEASQYYLQTASASVTPSFTATGDTTDCFNSATVALAVANNGATAPSTIHVARIIHESYDGFSSPGTQTVIFPTTGNLRVAAFTWFGGCPSGSPGCLTSSSLTSSDGCMWTQKLDGGGAPIYYAQNCAPCSNCTLSLVFSGGARTLPPASYRLYDVQNAAASSFQNSAGGNNTCGMTVTDAPTITPSGASSGLTIATNGNGQGPITAATSPPGAVFDLWTYAGQSDMDIADNADASSHLYFTSAATQNWNYTKTLNGDECYWEAVIFN